MKTSITQATKGVSWSSWAPEYTWAVKIEPIAFQSPNVSLKAKISPSPQILTLDHAEPNNEPEPPKIKLSFKSEPKIKHIVVSSLKVSLSLKIKAELSF